MFRKLQYMRQSKLSVHHWALEDLEMALLGFVKVNTICESWSLQLGEAIDVWFMAHCTMV